MAFEGDHFEAEHFLTRFLRVTMELMEYMKKIVLEPMPKSILLESANVDIDLGSHNISVELEEPT